MNYEHEVDLYLFQFLRLQGKSARRRGEEAIDIIDVHTDDLKVSDLELTKNISQVASDNLV